MTLYPWQVECLRKWADNGCKGIVNVATGAGKTILALAAVQALEDVKPYIPLKIKIIVPKTFLVNQWYHAIRDTLDIPREDIGLFLGSHKSRTERKFMIYVVNSARYTFTNHMLQNQDQRVLIIADECHHYGSSENAKIFDFTEVSGCGEYYTLGLSATPRCQNYKEVLVPKLGKEIYRFDFIQALLAGIISRFSLVNICLKFTRDERLEYDDLSDKLSLYLRKLKKNCPQLYVSNSRRFFAQLENIKRTHSDPDIKQLAETVSLLAFQRKGIVHSAKARIRCVIDLVRLIHGNAKIIVFGERIEMADMVYDSLREYFPGKVALYHSKIKESVRKTTLRGFAQGDIRILVSCKTLDEGLNISATDVGIVMSSTSNERQRIQRLGRILRKKDDTQEACFYYLYVENTIEETEVFRDVHEKLRDTINVSDITYDENDRSFHAPYYDELTQAALRYALMNSWSGAEIAELKRNFALGVITCDWLMSKTACLAKINNAVTRREKNYYIAMLNLIQLDCC